MLKLRKRGATSPFPIYLHVVSRDINELNKRRSISREWETGIFSINPESRSVLDTALSSIPFRVLFVPG